MVGPLKPKVIFEEVKHYDEDRLEELLWLFVDNGGLEVMSRVVDTVLESEDDDKDVECIYEYIDKPTRSLVSHTDNCLCVDLCAICQDHCCKCEDQCADYINLVTERMACKEAEYCEHAQACAECTVDQCCDCRELYCARVKGRR